MHGAKPFHEKPSFKKLIHAHRVLIPINGYYEWKRDGKIKTPYFIKPTKADAMFVGALFQPSAPASDEGSDKSQVCIVTVAANDEMSKVHHRMPVILKLRDALKWIQPSDQSTIDELMVPASNDALQILEVGDYVNSARNEGPECVATKRVNDLFGGN